MKEQVGKRLAIYSRKSRFTGKGESVENQIEMCRRFIAAQYGTEAAERIVAYEDEGFSGGTLDRPQFRKMMQAAEAGEIAAVVVYRLDRISRNIADFAGLIGKLDRLGVDFVSIREQFDTGNPMGRAMMYISSVFSQLERETIAERIRDNMHELSKTGRWLGGTTPTGYTSESVVTVSADGKTKKVCKLKIQPEEIRVVERIYEIFLETGSLTQVDAILLECGCVTKRGNRFTRFAIRNILTNPVYVKADAAAWDYLTRCGVAVFAEREAFNGCYGVMAYNRTLQIPGQANRQNPMDCWIVAIGQHEGIIPGTDWVRVQERLEQNRANHGRRSGNSSALLSGILRCGACGDYMRPKKNGRTGADGEPLFSYLCTTRERSKGACCTMKNPDGNLLDALVLDQIRTLGSCRNTVIRYLEQGKKILERDSRCELLELDQTISRKETEIGKLVKVLSNADNAAESYLLNQIELLHAEVADLRRKKLDLTATSALQILTPETIVGLAGQLADFGNVLNKMTVEQKRTAIRAVVSCVIWDENAACIYLRGENDGAGE